MCAEFLGERFFVFAATERHGLESHLSRILNAEMSKAADALDGNNVAGLVDPSGDFMTGNARILKSGPETFLDEDVAVTNATRLHLHAHLSATWLRNFAFD